jgi:hypothetical protein
MNYEKIYHRIINNSQQSLRKKVKNGTCYEKHHILPKSLGGTNSKDNLVLLTPKEHYICHKLLVEIYRGTNYHNKMYYAMWCMVNGSGNQERYSTSSRIYTKLKEELRQIRSQDRFDNRKFIEQYSLEGHLLNKHNSAKQASESTGVNRSSIENCAREESKSAGGFNWKYVDSNKEIVPVLHKKSGRKVGSPSSNRGKKYPPGTRNIKYKEVFQYTLSMDLVKKWESIQQASDSLQISRGSIENCARKTCKTSGGFIWRY